MKIEIDSKELFEFRLWVCENQYDGFDRALWYDLEEKKFFKTCESKSTNYVFNNPNNIILLIFVEGDNNSDGLYEVCDGCSGECDCEKEYELLSEVCFGEVCDEWYPIKPINWGNGEFEDIMFVEV